MKPPVFRIDSAEYHSRPLPLLAEMRSAGGVVAIKIPVFGTLPALTRYRDVDRFLRDHESFTRDGRKVGKRFTPGVQWWMPRFLRSLSHNMLAVDGDDHRRLRSLVDQAFMKRNVDSMSDAIGSIADRLLDQLERSAARRSATSGCEVELLGGFCRQFPLAVICELLGLPDSDRPQFTRWFEQLGNFSSIWSFPSMIRGLMRAQAYLKKQFEHCRSTPKPGLITELVLAEQDGGRLSEDELLAMTFLLLVAGHETTTHLISVGLLTLLDHPDELARLRSDWTLSSSAIDEILRFAVPVQASKPRYVSRDLEIGDQRFRRGEMLLGMLACANVDPEQFPQPEHFDITRSPNRHLSFGSGIHVCLGLKLAKMETAIAFQRLFQRYPDLKLAIDRKDVPWRARIGIRSLERLPIRIHG